MAESISGFVSITDTPLGAITVVAPYVDSWESVFPSGGIQAEIGNAFGALNLGGTEGIQYTIAGIDPVIQFLLTVRLRTAGQIWPLGYS